MKSSFDFIPIVAKVSSPEFRREWLTGFNLIRIGWYAIVIALGLFAWEVSDSPYHVRDYRYVSDRFSPLIFGFWYAGMAITFLGSVLRREWKAGLLRVAGQFLLFFLMFGLLSQGLVIYSEK